MTLTYRDDPEFQQFTESLSTKLFELISNISRSFEPDISLGNKAGHRARARKGA